MLFEYNFIFVLFNYIGNVVRHLFIFKYVFLVFKVAFWLTGNTLVVINEVTLCRARLVLGWVTFCGRVNHFGV